MSVKFDREERSSFKTAVLKCSVEPCAAKTTRVHSTVNSLALNIFCLFRHRGSDELNSPELFAPKSFHSTAPLHESGGGRRHTGVAAGNRRRGVPTPDTRAGHVRSFTRGYGRRATRGETGLQLRRRAAISARTHRDQPQHSSGTDSMQQQRHRQHGGFGFGRREL